MNKLIIIVGGVILLISVIAISVGLSPLSQTTNLTDQNRTGGGQIQNNTGIANPASVFCTDNGYALESRVGTSGGVANFCLFGDDSECEEWSYFRGNCNKTVGIQQVSIDYTTLKFLYDEFRDDLDIIDVRLTTFYNIYHIPASKNIPLTEVSARFNEVNSNKLVVVVAGPDMAIAVNAVNILSEKGLKRLAVVSYAGVADWNKAGYPVVSNI